MYCLLNYLFFILSLLDNTDWLAKFKRYRVYVSQEDQHAMPENTLGYYRPGTGRWGVHIIRVKANLPKNLKITVLCHQCAHFIEYVSNNSEHKKDRTELEVHIAKLSICIIYCFDNWKSCSFFTGGSPNNLAALFSTSSLVIFSFSGNANSFNLEANASFFKNPLNASLNLSSFVL